MVPEQRQQVIEYTPFEFIISFFKKITADYRGQMTVIGDPRFLWQY